MNLELTGSSGILITGNANNVDITGFDVGNSPDMSVGIGGYLGGCSSHSGTTASCGTSVHMIGNYVHDLAANVVGESGLKGCPSEGAIELGQHGYSAADVEVIGNLVVRYGFGGAQTGCNVAHGIYIDGQSAIIENNIVVGSPASNIQVYAQPCMAVVSNNVMINANYGMFLSGDGEGVCAKGSNTVTNNIFAGHLQGHINLYGGPCSGSMTNLESHNVSDGGADYANGPSSCDVVSPNPWAHVSNMSTVFVNYKADGTGDYHLKSNSPAINAGTTSCASGVTNCKPSADFEGNTYSNPPSVGAYK